MNAGVFAKIDALIGALKAMSPLNSVSIVVESEFPTPEEAIELSLFVSERINAVTIFERAGKEKTEITIKRTLGEI